MRKTGLVVTCAALALGAFAGPASAGNANGHGCSINKPAESFDNPGEMFRFLRADRGDNPRDVVNEYPGSFSSVGDMVAKKCGA